MLTAVRKPSTLVLAAVACCALGLASLLLPSGPTYDPYAWLIWGRDLAHLDLVTLGGGTSWKPLPALIAAPLSLLGGSAADGWLVIARGGALFAVFMAARLAWRLAGGSARMVAALVAAATVVLTQDWVVRNGVGNAEGLMAALGLLAVDRHLDGRRAQAFGLAVAVCLIRVEAWPLAFAYGAWLWFAQPRPSRAALGGTALLVPLLWFGGDWIGSGSLSTASDRALRHVPGSPGASAHPAAAVGTELLHMLPVPALAAIAVACAWALARRDRTLLAIAAGALGWTVVVAAMAQRGYPGLPRFLFMATALLAVLAGVGAARLAALVPGRMPAARGIAAVAACAAFALAAIPSIGQLPTETAAIDKVADNDAGLAAAVRSAGGPQRLLRCGQPVTRWWTVTALAWDLGVGSSAVHDRALGARPVVVAPDRSDWDVSGCGARSEKPRAPRSRAAVGSSRHGRSGART